MFHKTIQDLLDVAAAGPRDEDRLNALASILRSAEPFDCGEIVAHTENGLVRFVLAPGLGGAGFAAMDAMVDEVTLRLDTASELKAHKLATIKPVASVLVLRLVTPGVPAAALVLGHQRTWSFPAAPLARLRIVANVGLRLLLQPHRGAGPGEDTAAEVARLRAHIASLEAEIVALRTERSKQRPDKPR